MSAAVPINFRIPFGPANAAQANPAVIDGVTLAFYTDQRICPFGSNHPGGANFAKADGSCEFLSESISLTILQNLATRAGGKSAAELRTNE